MIQKKNEAILGRYKQKPCMTLHGSGAAAMIRGVGGLQICKDWQGLARDLHVVCNTAYPCGGRANPATVPRCIGWLVEWLIGWVVEWLSRPGESIKNRLTNDCNQQPKSQHMNQKIKQEC